MTEAINLDALEMRAVSEGLPWRTAHALVSYARLLEKDAARLRSTRSALEDGVANPPWRCFHCDEVFFDRSAAAEHFGTSLEQVPACQINIAKYRAMEEAFRRSRDEDTDLHREIYRLQQENSAALLREEEKGYARGLRDAALHPQEAALAAQGDAPAWWHACGYQTLFNAIAAATESPYPGAVGVSVIKFRAAMDAAQQPQTTAHAVECSTCGHANHPGTSCINIAPQKESQA